MKNKRVYVTILAIIGVLIISIIVFVNSISLKNRVKAEKSTSIITDTAVESTPSRTKTEVDRQLFGNMDGNVSNQLELVAVEDNMIKSGDVFRVDPKCYIIKNEKDGATTWLINSHNKTGGSFAVERNNKGKVYISIPEGTFNGYKDSSIVEITGKIESAGLNINEITIDVIDFESYDIPYIVLRLRDDQKSALLSSKWNAGKNLYTEIFNQQNIISINFIPTQNVEYYAFERDGECKIIEYDEDAGKISEFRLPDEINNIIRMNSDSITLGYAENKNNANNELNYKNVTYIKALDKTGKVSFYKIDYSLKTIAQYPNVKDLGEVYNLKWSFKGDLEKYSVLDEIGDVLILEGFDGKTSGAHEYSEILGVDKSTGKTVWNIDDFGYNKDYFLSSDRKKIFIYLDSWCGESSDKLIAMELMSGKIIWNKEIPDEYSILGISNAEVSSEKLIISSETVVEALDTVKGELVWKSDFGVNFQTCITNLLLAFAGNEVKAIDVESGKIKWIIDVKEHGQKGYNDFNDFGDDIVGLSCEGSIKLIDVRSGEIIGTLPAYDSVLSVEGYVLLGNNEKDVTDFYSLKQKKVIYSLNGTVRRFRSYICEDGLLFYNADHDTYSTARCVELKTGKVKWEFYNESYIDFKSISSSILWATMCGFNDRYVCAFDPKSGKLLYHAADYNLGGSYSYANGLGNMVKKSGNTLYVGKAYGYLDALELK